MCDKNFVSAIDNNNVKFNTSFPVVHMLDFTKNNCKNTAYVEILTSQHKFSPDCNISGSQPKTSPIFGTKFRINDGVTNTMDYSMPVFKFKNGTSPHIIFSTDCGYCFDMHWHGLNTSSDIDGATQSLYFGTDAMMGTVNELKIPKITNNSCLLWVHVHNMLNSSRFIINGLFSPVLIVDDISSIITDKFVYGDNHLILTLQDLDMKSDGTQDPSSLYVKKSRSCFTHINGISCINWYSSDVVPYVTGLKHKSSKNLVKIDLLGGNCSFRTYYIGICDKYNSIKDFYVVQTDQGFRNPIKLNMISLSPGYRTSILIDLNDFKHGEAYVFAYNFDLTEIGGTIKIVNNKFFNSVPDLDNYDNPTPFPTPIPDNNSDNQLTYPHLSKIKYKDNVETPCNEIVNPMLDNTRFFIKKFLKLNIEKDCRCKHNNIVLEEVIKDIRKVVFGKCNYKKYKHLMKIPNFEVNNRLNINYINMLNKKYFYNIPDIDNAPTRNIILFHENDNNYNYKINNMKGDKFGSTEAYFTAHLLFQDMWNSDELDLQYAINQYRLAIDNNSYYQPHVLPTCLFKIFSSKDDDKYINNVMSSNDKLVIEFFTTKPSYDPTTPDPTVQASATVMFPEISKPINIVKFVKFVNDQFAKTKLSGVNNELHGNNVSKYLTYDWSFYPWKINYIDNRSQYIKTVLMIMKNKTKQNASSPYFIRFTASCNLLQIFGKPVGARPGTNNNSSMFPNNYNCNITSMYQHYATYDPNIQIQAQGMSNIGHMIIDNIQDYKGFIDGFQNDNMLNFSTKQDSTEKWIYHNLDRKNSHPIHFHLTGGYINPFDCDLDKCLIDNRLSHNSILYTKDIYNISSQKSVSFYLKFTNFNSSINVLRPIYPSQKYLGYMIHCHYMTHHDLNMMSQFFVYSNRNDYF